MESTGFLCFTAITQQIGILDRTNKLTPNRLTAMRTRKPPTKAEALLAARRLREALLKKKLPVHNIFLFGSVAKGAPHEWSDIDIAVICDPFEESRHEENMAIRVARRDIDVRISPICLHPDEMGNRYSAIAQEVKRYGIPVE